MEFGEVGRRIAEIGAETPRQQFPVEHEDIVADGRGTGLGPANDTTCDGGAVNGAD